MQTNDDWRWWNANMNGIGSVMFEMQGEPDGPVLKVRKLSVIQRREGEGGETLLGVVKMVGYTNGLFVDPILVPLSSIQFMNLADEKWASGASQAWSNIVRVGPGALNRLEGRNGPRRR